MAAGRGGGADGGGGGVSRVHDQPALGAGRRQLRGRLRRFRRFYCSGEVDPLPLPCTALSDKILLHNELGVKLHRACAGAELGAKPLLMLHCVAQEQRRAVFHGNDCSAGCAGGAHQGGCPRARAHRSAGRPRPHVGRAPDVRGGPGVQDQEQDEAAQGVPRRQAPSPVLIQGPWNMCLWTVGTHIKDN